MLLRVHTAAKNTGGPAGIQQTFGTFETCELRNLETHKRLTKKESSALCGIPGAVDAAPIEYHGPLEYFKAAVQRPDLPRSAGTM